MSSKYIKGMRTNEGDLKFDYNSLANKPTNLSEFTNDKGYFMKDNLDSTLKNAELPANSKSVGDRFVEVENKISKKIEIPAIQGTFGQFAVSDGKNGIIWKTIGN